MVRKILTKEHKRKISISVKKTWNNNPSRRIMSKNHKNKISKANKDNKKLSESLKKHFRKNGMSLEIRQKISNANKGKVFSKQHKENLKHSWVTKKNKPDYIPAGLGRQFSEETKQKIRNSNLGKKRSIKTRNKLSIALKGRKLSKEHKKKIGKAVKGRKHSENTKKQQRISAIKYIEKTSFGGKMFRSRIGKNEKQFLDEIELSNNIKIIRQYEIEGYFLDGYYKSLNIVFEIDENTHIFKKEKDLHREQNIQKELNCKFIRIKDY